MTREEDHKPGSVIKEEDRMDGNAIKEVKQQA